MLSVAGSIENHTHNHQDVHLATSNVRFSKILVGTDFSKPATQALAAAVAIGQRCDSEVFLVNAVPPYVDNPEAFPVSPEVFQGTLDRARENMKEFISHEPGLHRLRTKTTVAYAGAVELIEQVANNEKVDLIVVGSHGASGIERLALGSVAEAILRKASCPVLVTGPNCYAEHHPFRSILLATDLETTGLRPAQYATALAQHIDSQLTLLHVVENIPRIPGLDSEVLENSLRQKLQQLLPAHADFFCAPKIRVEYGAPAQVILDVAKSELASMVIVGLRHRAALSDHLPWSTLSHIIRNLRCSVLVVRSHLA